MENSDLLRTAYALRDKGEYKKALDIFVGIADQQENPLERAGMLLNIVNTLPNSGQLELAKTQLESVRSLLSSSLARDSDHPYPRYHRYLTILADLEDARICEAEESLTTPSIKLTDCGQTTKSICLRLSSKDCIGRLRENADLHWRI